MDQCDSTWLEVFDNRWEVVHSWGGCPTWQMSKFLLGLCPRADAGESVACERLFSAALEF